MVPGVDLGVGCRARMKVEPIFGGVKYKKREAIAPLKYTLRCYQFLTVTAELFE